MQMWLKIMFETWNQGKYYKYFHIAHSLEYITICKDKDGLFLKKEIKRMKLIKWIIYLEVLKNDVQYIQTELKKELIKKFKKWIIERIKMNLRNKGLY